MHRNLSNQAIQQNDTQQNDSNQFPEVAVLRLNKFFERKGTLDGMNNLKVD